MNIRDIVNHESVNLQNCESEPIHIPGTIQPHGFLLGLNEKTLSIAFCSANINNFLLVSPQQILGKYFQTYFSEDDSERFILYLNKLHENPQPFVFTIQNIPYNTTVHKSGQTVILEFEPFPDGSMTSPDLYVQTRNFVSMIEGATNLQSLCQAVANETKNITGYDRVMIYRFDKDYNGEIFAESKEEHLEPFLGLNYPHTDIPAQARELYMRNLLRIIVDVHYVPVPILTLDENFEQKKNLDLSLSVLRSVSPIHIEYLQNMGVQGTLNISLIHNKKLWGLIACHHYSYKNVPHYTRLAAKLQGHFLTSQIDVRQMLEEHELAQAVEDKLATLMTQLNDNDNIIEKLIADKYLYEFVNAEGVAIMHNGRIFVNGKVPEEKDIKVLACWLFENIKSGELISAKLEAIYQPAHAFVDNASGIIYYSLGKNEEDCILWFRPEVITTINWAGNPDKAVIKNEGIERLSPRKSFDLWKQSIQKHSSEWNRAEISGSYKFANALQKQFHFIKLSNEEDKLRKIADKLKSANEELNSMNWISAHDLREPLRKIQMFASKITDNPKNNLPENVVNDVNKMRQTASRMQHLLNDILNYSLIANKEVSLVRTNLNDILNEVLAELNEEIILKNALIHADELPNIPVVNFQIRQMFINLLQNALKFKKANIAPEIKIKYALVNSNNEPLNTLLPNTFYHKLCVKDNGIGFENIYADRILNIFQRLHEISEYSGTGIGLAICKKIVENHNGFITANGKVNEGAEFCIWLPATN